LSGGVYSNVSEPGLISGAGGINNAGLIVGSANGHGFLLSAGTYTDFVVPASLATTGLGVNDAAHIVGAYFDHLGGATHGFLLSGDAYTTIDVPGASMTETIAINNAGDIVGIYDDASGKIHSFMATPVPEPFALALLSIGAVALLAWAWRPTLGIR